MVLISKEDKEIWKKYTLNMKKLRFVINKNEENFNKKNLNKYIKEKNNQTYTNDNTFNRFIKLLNKNKSGPDGVIDLHGYNLKDAKSKLISYLINAFNHNKRNILIITGKGLNNTGLLKKEVPFWLNEKELKKIIVIFEHAPSSFGGEGALIIRLKNKQRVSI